jgi:hypothetical protein
MPKIRTIKLLAACITTFSLFFSQAMSEEEPTELEKLAAQTELLNAKKTLLVSELAYLEELQKVEKAKEPPQPESTDDISHQAALEEAERIKTQAEANKAAAEAQTAAADALKANAALGNAKVKSLFGEVENGGIDGSVTTGENAGVAEAALLAAQGLRVLSDEIASDLDTIIGNKKVWLVSDENIPGLGAMVTFELQSQKIEKDTLAALAEADTVLSDAKNLDMYDTSAESTSRESVAGVITGIGAGLDVLSKIGKYFQSQYTVSGVNIEILGDKPLVDALAGSLSQRGKVVYTPSRFHPAFSAPISIKENEVFKKLSDLTDLVPNLMEKHSLLQGHIQTDAKEKIRRDSALAEFKKKLAAIKDTDANADSQRGDFNAKISKISQLESEWALIKGRIDVAVAKVVASITSVSQYVDGLTSKANDQPRPPIVDLVLENHMLKALRSGDILFIANLTGVKGSQYTRKNLWTFFGKLPFYHMAGAVVNYSVIDGPKGNVLKADTVMHHSGFMKSHKVKEALEQ